MYSGSWGDLEGVIKCQMEEAPHYDLGTEMEPRKEAAAFNKPIKGTSVEKFREMIFNYLKVRKSSLTGEKVQLKFFLSSSITMSSVKT